VHGLRVGRATVQVLVQRGPGSMALQLRGEGGQPTIVLELPVPPGARVGQVTVDDTPQAAERLEGPQPRVRLEVPLGQQPRTVALTWEGGLEVVPPTPPLTPGQTSDGIRILDLAWRDSGWDLLVEGLRGRGYDLLLNGVIPGRADGGTLVPRADLGNTGLRVEFATGAGRETRLIRITP
jgi:hypothetical protein